MEPIRNAVEDFRTGLAELPGIDYETAMIHRAEERNRQEKVERANIPLRYQGARFENMKTEGCPADIRPIAKAAYRYAQNLKDHIRKGEGLIFSGTAGRMKTTLACCIAQKAIDAHVGVYFISMPELLDMLVSMSRNRDTTELRNFESRIRDISLLILDDFGAEYPSGWVLNKVDAIITNRYNNLKPVIITTNLLKGEMQERYVTRVFDRLRSANRLLTVSGDSLRPNAGESRKGIGG